MHAYSARRFRSQAGFKIAELMVAVGIFAVGGGIAYPLLVGDVALYARNFSLNKSSNSLRYSLARLKQDIDLSIAPPTLVNYRLSGTTCILQPQPDTVHSAYGILLWVNLGPAYDMQGSDPGGLGAVPVTSTITLKRRLYSTSDPSPTSPMPQIGDRLIIMSPSPFSIGMPETVTMDGNTIQKPGRRIVAVNGATSGTIADSGASSMTVKLDLGNTALPSPITGPQSVYIVREVAYVVSTLNDSSNNPVESRLIRYASTNDMTNGLTLIRDVDPAPLENDPNTGATIVPFNYYQTVRGPFSINLPVRAIDYANAIAASEFNVYVRSNLQMTNKVTNR